MTYSEKLQDPRWQKKRLEVMERDGWQCQHCHSATKPLTVHHLRYRPGRDPWDYASAELLTLCSDCHAAGHTNQTPCCSDCHTALYDANLGGSTGAGKMNDPARGLGVCVTCAELRELAR